MKGDLQLPMLVKLTANHDKGYINRNRNGPNVCVSQCSTGCIQHHFAERIVNDYRTIVNSDGLSDYGDFAALNLSKICIYFDTI